MMRVADRMTANPVTVSQGETLAMVREPMKGGTFRSLLMVEVAGSLPPRSTAILGATRELFFD
jgi:hypothetical protein